MPKKSGPTGTYQDIKQGLTTGSDEVYGKAADEYSIPINVSGKGAHTFGGVRVFGKGLAFLIAISISTSMCGCAQWPEKAIQKTETDHPSLQTIKTDPYFIRLSTERQRVVSQAVIEADLDKEIHGMLGPTSEEMAFLISKGIYERPSWPGYRSFIGEKGVVILVPETELSPSSRREGWDHDFYPKH